jgi:hypothetical protein
MTVARQTYGEDPCFYPHLRAIVIGLIALWDTDHRLQRLLRLQI